MILALIGNQNCGKTTLFNQLTGSNQHVGNFPGVTVDSKEGVLKRRKDVTDVYKRQYHCLLRRGWNGDLRLCRLCRPYP